jgi:hypothetical protein
MKKKLPIAVMLVLFVAGCKIDESGLPNKNTVIASGAIVGTWYLKTQVTTGTAFGMPLNDTQNTAAGDVDDYFLFKSDKTCAISESGPPKVVTPGTYVYDASNKLLTIADTTDGGSYTVNKITSDSLVLFISVSVPALATQTNVTLKFAHK